MSDPAGTSLSLADTDPGPLGCAQQDPICSANVKLLSCVRLFETPWTVAYQAPLSMGFSRQEYWSGLPFPSPGVLPDPGIETGSPALQADALLSESPGKPSKGGVGLPLWVSRERSVWCGA